MRNSEKKWKGILGSRKNKKAALSINSETETEADSMRSTADVELDGSCHEETAAELPQLTKRSSLSYLWQQLRRSRTALYVGVGAAVLSLALVYAFTFSDSKTGCAICVDGQQVAVVNNRSAANDVLNELQAGGENGEARMFREEIAVERVKTAKADILAAEEAEAALSEALTQVVQAATIVIDGEQALALADQAAANRVIEAFIDKFRYQNNDDYEVLSLRFEETVEVAEALVEPDELLSEEDALAYLCNGAQNVITHTVQADETFWTIAQKYDMNVYDLMRLNADGTEGRLQVGQELKITQASALLHVDGNYRYTARTPIAYDTTYIYDSELAHGEQEIEVAGVEGEEDAIYFLSMVNGTKIASQELGSQVVSEPVTQVIRRSSAFIASASRSGSYNPGNGALAWPFNGNITCPFGGYSGHTGMDIDGETGDIIRAAADGTVVFAGWGGGYGNIIKIDHGNGLATWYAHLSTIGVSEGQSVSTGEVIAQMGSTGNSTGSHLHFEVRVDGNAQNPANYLK